MPEAANPRAEAGGINQKIAIAYAKEVGNHCRLK